MWGPPGAESSLPPWERPEPVVPVVELDRARLDYDPAPWEPWRSHAYEVVLFRSSRRGWLWIVHEHTFTERGWRPPLGMFERGQTWAPTERWARWRARRLVASLRDVRRCSAESRPWPASPVNPFRSR